KRNSNNNPLLNIRKPKSKSHQNSNIAKSEADVGQHSLKASFSDHEDDFQEDDDQEDAFSDLQDFDKSDSNVSSNYSDQQDFDEFSSIFEEEEFSDKIKAADFIFEKSTSQNLENTFNPYFANFTEMSLFTW
ncbi:14849_t:CDS:1, partial [Racocetra persica]